jgi:hypothetical protein
MSRTLRFPLLTGGVALVFFSFLVPVCAQTQASCQFTTFNRLFLIPGGNRLLVPRGVNDYGTVVGDAQDNTDFSVRGFTRSSSGGITYYRHTSNGSAGNTTFTDRTNGGVNTGVADSSAYTYLASASGTPFTLQGSTFTPLTMTISGATYSKFTLWGVNRWATGVGAFKDSSGKMNGFKRYSDGKGIALDFPGAAETAAVAINDSGTIVGWYSKHLPPTEWRHGFLYSNGKWATLDYPGTQQTSLTGISNANLIVGSTIKGTNETGSFLYQSGTFKSIVLSNAGGLVTAVRGVSPSKGLIAGFNGYSGFIATCH